MGSLTNKYGNVAPPPSPVVQRPVAPQGGMIRSGGSVGPTGPRINFTDPSVSAAEVTATTTAKNQANAAFKSKAYNDFYNEITATGKPVADITYGDLLKVAKGNLDLANQFISTRNAFLGKKSDLQNTQTAVVKLLGTFANAARRIPAAKGFIGKRLQGPLNAINQELGQLPQREAYLAMLNISGPLLRRAMGDVGNAGQRETEMALDALKGLAHPQQEVRDESLKLLNNAFTDLIGTQTHIGETKTKAKENALDIQIQKLEQELLGGNNP